jgi:glucans biosynthesis protein C
MPTSRVNTRLVYVDRLRVFAVLAVFIIHVCEVFNPWDEWHITAPVRSRILGEVVVVLAPWIMPLFMLLAGVSAFYSLGRRRNGEYLKERARRLLVPLVLGVLILVPPQVYLERLFRRQFSGSFIAFYPHFFDGIYPSGNFSWHHLWFLGHLALYSVIALPLFRFWQRPRGEGMLRSLGRLYSSPHGLLWLALPLIIERTLLWGILPERHMLESDWSNHALLLVAYLYGFILAATPSLGKAIDAQWRWTLVVALATSAIMVFGTWIDILPAGLPRSYSWQYEGFWALYAVGAWAWVVTVLGVARRWLHREGPELRYGREIGYEWYLFHQPVIVAAAYWVVTWRVGLLEQFVSLLAISACGTWTSVKLFRSGSAMVQSSVQALRLAAKERRALAARAP